MMLAKRFQRLLSAMTFAALISLCVTPATAKNAQDKPSNVGFESRDGQVDVLLGGRVVATYIYQDAKTHRPFFKNVKTPSGIQVTRNHPPVEGKDRTDHPDMHPGLWLAFGDLGGHDFWRNKGPRVEHERFTKTPEGGPGRGMFEVVNHYLADGRTVCRETARYTVVTRPAGYLILWDSTFTSESNRALDFGEQEEMGLGVRVATPLAVKGGSGTIRNSRGGVDEKGTWGQSADWCDYAGTIDGHHVGVTLMAPPGGATKPWFHSRDYGVLVANPFGPRAGVPARLSVDPGASFRLRLAIFVHDSDRSDGVDIDVEYQNLEQSFRTERESGRAVQPVWPSPAVNPIHASTSRLPGLHFLVETMTFAGYLGIPLEFQKNSRREGVDFTVPSRLRSEIGREVSKQKG
jgi:hypothetical protein